jgi:glycosyltransferase involved in cell wall biosynthesis
MLEPLISVVIPVYNRERTIGRAIESALQQSRPPAEILVVDDGSTDGSAEAIAAYGSHVRYVHQPNAGASVARNYGVGRAVAPWVAFLDSDDHWLEDHLATMAEAISATGGEAGFYFADCLRPTTEGGASWWRTCGFAVPDRHCLVDDATDWVLMDLQPTMLQSSVFARDRYLAAGGLWSALRTRHDTHLFIVMGIGSAACAVACGGAQMTSDDDSGQRLTEAFGPETRDWWLQTKLMYVDVLRRFPDLANDDRRRLKERLATADLRLGQAAWHNRRVGPAGHHLLQGMRVAPGYLAASAVRRIGRTARDHSVAPFGRGWVRARETVG